MLFRSVFPTIVLFRGVTYLFIITLLAGVVAIGMSFRRRSVFRRCVGTGLCAAATLGSFALVAYASGTGRPIKLVIPNDYTGEIVIALHGQGTPPEFDGVSWVYRIGDDGRLMTLNDCPFSRWHQMKAEFRDGRVILDMTCDMYEGHGYKLTGGETSIAGNSPWPTYHWRVQRTNVNNAVEPTRAPESARGSP